MLEQRQSGPILCPNGHRLAELVDGVVIVRLARKEFAGRISYLRCDCGGEVRLPAGVDKE